MGKGGRKNTRNKIQETKKETRFKIQETNKEQPKKQIKRRCLKPGSCAINATRSHI